jgi:hypothetical protein
MGVDKYRWIHHNYSIHIDHHLDMDFVHKHHLLNSIEEFISIEEWEKEKKNFNGSFEYLRISQRCPE